MNEGQKNVLANIALARKNVEKSRNVRTVVLVTGSYPEMEKWQEKLNVTSRHIFNKDGSTGVFSLQEKCGKKTREGNFLGSILAYSELKKEACAKGLSLDESVVLVGMLFGRGERMSPFTQIEADCKPAIAATAASLTIGGKRYNLSQAEESLLFFSPVAAYLEKKGFRGMVNKWGDETQVPSIPIETAGDGAFEGHDIIKFVSAVEMTDKLAREKDWVVFSSDGDFVAQIARAEKNVLMEKLRGMGVSLNYAKGLAAGVSLGPVAVSYRFLEAAAEVFWDDLSKEGVYLDFDPYVLMLFALGGDEAKFTEFLSTDGDFKALAGERGAMPDLFSKVKRVMDVFRARHKRDIKLKVLDLGKDVFWTDLGQHYAMREKYLSLNDGGDRGVISRCIENVPDKRDKNGNIIVDSRISPGVEVRDSVIVNSVISGKSRIEKSVVKDSTLADTCMTGAFSVLSHRAGRTVLAAGSGIYRSYGSSLDRLELKENEREGTLLTAKGPVSMRVLENAILKGPLSVYDVRVLGNSLSFREAYDEMSGVSEEELERRRARVMEDIRAIDRMNKHFKVLSFGTSGLRDTVENMTDMECYINTRGFLSFLATRGEFKKGSSVAVGGDRRPSTFRIKTAIAAAIRDMGGKVDYQGLVASPALAHYAIYKGIPSVMVTGSHIPVDRNGIKFTKISGEVLKTDEAAILSGVTEERKKVYGKAAEASLFDDKGMFIAAESKKARALLKEKERPGKALKAYVKRYATVFGRKAFPKGAKIFLYQHSAVGRDTVKEIFESLGAEVIAPRKSVTVEYHETGKEKREKVLLRSAEFVPVDTESVSGKTMAVFSKVMNEYGLDAGISLDGDSDRPLLVYRVYRDGKPTDEVRYVTGDILGLLTVEALGELGVRIDAVCVPVSANDAIGKVLGQKGVELSLTKIGSPYVIAAMNESLERHGGKGKASWNVFSWESNGGFLLGSDIAVGGKPLKALPTRDGVLPLISVLMASARKGVTVSGLVDALPGRFTHADRKKEFPVEKGNAVIRYLSPATSGSIKEVNFLPDGRAAAVYMDGKSECSVGGSDYHRIKSALEKLFDEKEGFAKITAINYIDGVRIYFSNGEISHFRPSGNAPEFRNYAIAGSPERARRIVEIGLSKIVPELARLAEKDGR